MAENELDPRSVAERLLKEARGLAVELRPQSPPPTAGLDGSLDADFGLDSLGRVELMSRLEEAFGVALPERAMADAETCRDLLRAVLSASAPGGALELAEISSLETPGKAEAPGIGAPDKAGTLVEVLAWRANAHPDRLHIRFYDDKEDGETLSYGQLRDGAARMAAGLQGLGLGAGQAVMIMLPTGREYFLSFIGILLAGGIPVPIYPPARAKLIEQHIMRHKHIADNCQAKVLITATEALTAAALLKAHCPNLDHVVTPEDLSQGGGELMAPAINPKDTAFLQYTSGSTGDPKGVVLSHANLLANIRAMGEALEVTSKDVFVSWLPLYHDMGLIGAWLGSLYHATTLVIMTPLAFLARPRRWLWAMHRHGGTITAAPNFAYEQCLNRIPEKDLKGLDLSSWRAALNGAEAVSPDTISAFAERFKPYGFDARALMPVYGLAECSVGLAFPPLGRGALIDRIVRETFASSGNAAPAPETDASARRVPACGRPLPGHQIRVVDAAGHELPERREGRLQFKGPSTTSGYFRNAEATRELFDGEWLNSGDLAYIAGGDVHITGRIKDVIIRAGRNIYPDELEQAVGEIDGVRKGNIAVFSCAEEDGGPERLIVLAETREKKAQALDKLRALINDAVTGVIGGPPDEVSLVPPRTVPKTSSGKIRRAASRQIYQSGVMQSGDKKSGVWGETRRAPLWLALGLRAAAPSLRRALAALSAILYGGLWWIWLGLLCPFTWILAVVLPVAAWRWAVVRLACKLLLNFPGTSVSVRGLENLPDSGAPCVYVSNHASYLDSCALLATLPRAYAFVAKAELAGKFMSRVFLSRIGAFFVERFDKEKSAADAARMAEMVGRGRAVMVFVEGTCQRMPGLLPFQLGAFATAAEAGAPVVPITIRGTRAVLRSDTWLPRPGAIAVTVDAPIETEEGSEKDAFAKAVKLRDATRARILSRCGEPDLGRERILETLAAD